MNTKLLGRWGENKAAKYLQENGYTVIGMNYASRFGEIDIIAEKKGVVAFVEVKLRRNNKFAEGREFVDQNKQARIVTTAGYWLCQNETGKQPRFDVIEIYAPEGMATQSPVIHHIQNAFHAHE